METFVDSDSGKTLWSVDVDLLSDLGGYALIAMGLYYLVSGSSSLVVITTMSFAAVVVTIKLFAQIVSGMLPFTVPAVWTQGWSHIETVTMLAFLVGLCFWIRRISLEQIQSAWTNAAVVVSLVCVLPYAVSRLVAVVSDPILERYLKRFGNVEYSFNLPLAYSIFVIPFALMLLLPGLLWLIALVKSRRALTRFGRPVPSSIPMIIVWLVIGCILDIFV